MPRSKNKYRYLFVLQGNFGYGWKDLEFTESLHEALADERRYYADESGASYRIINRRVLNDVN